MPKEQLPEPERKTTHLADGLQLPEFFRVTEDEMTPDGKQVWHKATKEGEPAGYFWLPRVGKKGGKYFLCLVERDGAHILVHAFCPHTTSELAYLDICYVRNIFWAPEAIVTELIPTLGQMEERRSNARTLACWSPVKKEQSRIITDLG